MNLPLANILHHKLRSLLSAVGIAIGVCMLVTLTGLSRGSLFEVSDRWEAIDADLILCPKIWEQDMTNMKGLGTSDSYLTTLPEKHGDLIEQLIPVFLWPMKLAGQPQVCCGVEAENLPRLTGGKGVVEGRVYQPKMDWQTFVAGLLQKRTVGLTPRQKEDYILDITAADLREGGWLEIVIDRRLARAGKYTVGDEVATGNHRWTIVGIVSEGSLSRVFLPRKTAQFLFGSGDTNRSTLIFAKLRPTVTDHDAVCRTLSNRILQAIQVQQYRTMLQERFGMLFVYVDAVNGIALVIAFLFVMTTLYMMVLQQTREIAILKSCGASGWFVLRQIVAESLILTTVGTLLGIAMSLAAAWAIQRFLPLLTVEFSWHWLFIAMGAAGAGALIAAIFPAWRAWRVDMVEALTYE